MCETQDPVAQKPEGVATPNWTEDERLLLRHETLIREVERLRKPEPETQKPRWLLFLESSGGTAVIAALLGGVLVQWISGSIQEHAKMREFQQAWMQARGSQALAAYKERSDQEEQLASRSFDLVGNGIQTSEDLIDIRAPELTVENYKKEEDRKRIIEQRNAIRKVYNEADKQRRREGEKISLLMALYYHDRPDVTNAWQAVRNDLTEYMDCASTWYGEHGAVTADVAKNACAKEKNTLRGSVDNFTAVLEKASSTVREDWESPDRLMQQLAKAFNR